MAVRLIYWTNRILRDRRGVSAMEYAILAAAIVVAVAAVAANLGHEISNSMNSLIN